MDYAAHLILISHYCVCIWLSIGDKYLMDDYHDPWQISNESFQTYNNY